MLDRFQRYVYGECQADTNALSRLHRFGSVFLCQINGQRAQHTPMMKGDPRLRSRLTAAQFLCARVWNRGKRMDTPVVKDFLIQLAAALDAPGGQGSGAVLLEAHTLIEEYERRHPPSPKDD